MLSIAAGSTRVSVDSLLQRKLSLDDSGSCMPNSSYLTIPLKRKRAIFSFKLKFNLTGSDMDKAMNTLDNSRPKKAGYYPYVLFVQYASEIHRLYKCTV
jgi:hypothetical protein